MIYFLGDVHGKLDHILPAIRRDHQESAAVIFLGDIEIDRPFESEIRPLTEAGLGVWFITGNHDSERSQNWAHLQQSMHRCLDGRVEIIQGVRIAGLGGVFRAESWYPDRPHLASADPVHKNYEELERALAAKYATPRRNKSLWNFLSMNSEKSKDHERARRHRDSLLKHRCTIFSDTYQYLARQQADVLVTHEAPSCHPKGFATIDHLAKRLGVHTLFHGHQHESLDYAAYTSLLGFRPYGVGLRGITDVNGLKVLPGARDGSGSR